MAQVLPLLTENALTIPWNILKISWKYPENTLKNPWTSSFQYSFPMLSVGMPFAPFQFLTVLHFFACYRWFWLICSFLFQCLFVAPLFCTFPRPFRTMWFTIQYDEAQNLGCRKWGCNKWRLKGCLAALLGNRLKLAFFALFLPFSAFSREGAEGTWEIQKRAFLLRYPQICLNPISYTPICDTPRNDHTNNRKQLFCVTNVCVIGNLIPDS